MAQNVKLGQKGEQIAFEYLVKKGYQVINRNWRYDRFELDIIAIYEEKLVIVEVKTRAAPIFEEPNELISNNKIRHIVNAAEAYIIEFDIDRETRFDLVSIKWYGDEKYEIEHYPDAFTPPVH